MPFTSVLNLTLSAGCSITSSKHSIEVIVPLMESFLEVGVTQRKNCNCLTPSSPNQVKSDPRVLSSDARTGTGLLPDWQTGRGGTQV